jgi:hypothetical protein
VTYCQYDKCNLISLTSLSVPSAGISEGSETANRKFNRYGERWAAKPSDFLLRGRRFSISLI